MPQEKRDKHDYLTDATRETLAENVKAVADAWGVTDRYIYLIVGEERADPMRASAFLDHYEKLCKRGVSVEKYDREMAFMREKHARSNVRQPSEAFKDTFSGHNQLFERYLAAISDGTLDLAETNDILDLIGIEKPLIDQLERSLLAHKAKLEK